MGTTERDVDANGYKKFGDESKDDPIRIGKTHFSYCADNSDNQ